MEWNDISHNPIIIENYSLFDKSGILAFIEHQKKEINSINMLMEEAYELFLKKSVHEIVTYVLYRLSDKFIPSSLQIIFNEGILVDRIKILTFRNMQAVDEPLDIKTLKPFEDFFKKNTGTIKYQVLKDEIDQEVLISLNEFSPEIIVPILGISGLYGIILFGPKILNEEYSPEEINYINGLMKFTSISIQNTIHYENSVKESKTGLYNHNFFNSRLTEEIARSKRTHAVFSILIMDIDKFKNFNDTYGHMAGDEVINNLAGTLKRTIREEDILSRFGGEEFTVLLPDTKPDQAWFAAERLRQAVENMKTTYEEHLLHVTISIGIASVHPYNLGTAEGLIKRADEALYQSKERGRNRTTHFRSGLLYQVLDTDD